MGETIRIDYDVKTSLYVVFLKPTTALFDIFV